MSPSSEHDPSILVEQIDFARRLARRLVTDVHAGDDLAQEGCVAVLRRPPRDPARLTAYLSTILRRLRGRSVRTERRRDRREQATAVTGSVAATVDVVAAMEVHRRVVDAVMDLPAAQREAILLRFFEDLSVGEIASRCDAPAETIRSRIRRGLAKVREALDSSGRGEAEDWLPALLVLAGPGSAVPPATAGASRSPWIGRVLLPLGIIAASLVLLVLLVGTFGDHGESSYDTSPDRDSGSLAGAPAGFEGRPGFWLIVRETEVPIRLIGTGTLRLLGPEGRTDTCEVTFGEPNWVPVEVIGTWSITLDRVQQYDPTGPVEVRVVEAPMTPVELELSRPR